MKLDFSRTFEDDPLTSDHGAKVSARKPWAILASMGVLLFGALFILISAIAPISPPSWTATTKATDQRSILSLKPSATPEILSASLTSPSSEENQPAGERNGANINSNSIAPSSEASAPAEEQGRRQDQFIPRLKPTRMAAKISDTNVLATKVETQETIVAIAPTQTSSAASTERDPFTPRLKPSQQKRLAGSSKKSTDYTNIAHTNPINLLPVALASNEDNPPPFFSTPTNYQPQTSNAKSHLHHHIPVGDVQVPISSQTFSLQRGESFVDLLSRAGIRRQDRNAAALALGKHLKLRKLQQGLVLDLTIAPPNYTWFQAAMAPQNEASYLIQLEVRPDSETNLSLKRNPTGEYQSALTPITMTKRLQTIRGQIDGNLYTSMRQLGAPDDIVHSLANVFAFDVDFQRDIFRGDQFEAIYEVWYDDNGEIIRGGDILFAHLNWRGRRNSKGYYLYNPESKVQQTDFFDTTGQSARRLLMKTPIDGARLSSRFGPRKHPILGYRKTHKGVDFAARRGTPIKATGDGVIERANRYGSFGNYVRIRHANGYKTAYAHLKGFARSIKKGRRVRQGDIIGYVGTTGRSTGPHLHYEVHHAGKAINPQKLKIATGIKLNASALEAFLERRNMIDRLREPVVQASSHSGNTSVASSITGK